MMKELGLPPLQLKEIADNTRMKVPKGYGVIVILVPFSNNSDGCVEFVSDIPRKLAISTLRAVAQKAEEDLVKRS